MRNNCVAIIADGEEVRSFKDIINNVDVIIAADGGANLCRSINITPDYIIGDLDSVSADNLNYFSNSQIVKIIDQNTTDMQKAIKLALSIQPMKIKIISAFGKRTDHTLANLLIFQNYDNKIPIEIYDNSGVMKFITKGENILLLKPGQIISLFSFSRIEGLTMEGFEFPVHNKNFENNFIGISNKAVQSECKINFTKGKLAAYLISV